MSMSHEQRMTIANVENNGATSYVEAARDLERKAAHWGGKWAMFHVVMGKVEYWAVLGGRAIDNVGNALGWDLVTTAGGEA